MTRPDHIGADPALGTGAGQTRRGTPVDLAREVLDSAKYAESRFMSISDMPSIGRSAPALARAVLAVAEVAEKYETTARDIGGDFWVGALASKTAQDIRAALNGDNA